VVGDVSHPRRPSAGTTTSRRRFLEGIAAGGLVATAGCLGGVLSDATSFEADPATVEDGAADDAGYEHQGTTSSTNEREFAGQTVTVTSYVSEYHRGLDLPFLETPEAGVVAAVATPKVAVAGETFNPVADDTRAEIAERVQEQYSDLSIGGSAGTRTVQTLGDSATVETFEGSATFVGGTDIDVFVDVARLEHGDDFVVVVGVYPRTIPGEKERVDAMIAGLEHET
jgi:hypothetical protein